MIDNLRIGVVDTGIDSSHPWLEECKISSWAVDGGPQTECVDIYGHGTGVATIIHSQCQDAELISARISKIPIQKQFNLVPEVDIAKGILWCVENGAQVVNVSYGIPRIKGPLQKACQTASESRAVIVTAYSNYGGPSFPASFPTVIGVKRLRQGNFGDVVVESKSNRDLSAYGGPVHVGDTNHGVSYIGGTSLSSAHVSALMGRVLSLRQNVATTAEAFELISCLESESSPRVEEAAEVVA